MLRIYRHLKSSLLDRWLFSRQGTESCEYAKTPNKQFSAVSKPESVTETSKMGETERIWDQPKLLETRLIELLNPLEPVVMRLQSLFVWEYPRKSVILLVVVHLMFWAVAWSHLQVYFLFAMSLMVTFFVDTWKNKIWPEIRVPPPIPEDVDGWTPVHPRLLSVPEISHHLAAIICSSFRILGSLRQFRRDKPFLFFLLSAAVFVSLAALGQYMCGFLIIYTIVMSIMIWPSVVYHNLLKRAYLRMEPIFMWLDYQLKSKCYIRRGNQALNYPEQPTHMALSQGVAGRDGRPSMLAQVVEEVEEDDFVPSIDPVTAAALARAITDSEDEGTGGTPSLPTPGLSKEPSIDNSDDEKRTEDFSLDVDAMPSFDDLDHSDDDMTPVIPSPDAFRGASQSSGDMAFSTSHFSDSDSDSEDEEPGSIGFPDVTQTVLASDTDPMTAVLTSTLVTKTLSSMMETALQGMMGLGSSGQATSSGVLPRTGTKITYTKTSKGECIDFATPEPTIAEDEEGCEPSDDEPDNPMDDTVNNEVAEIEKDFDFLEELDEGQTRATTKS